jgi:hypothetical protein
MDERINKNEIRKGIKKETEKDLEKKSRIATLISLCDNCHLFGCSSDESKLIWLAYSESHYSLIHSLSLCLMTLSF